MAFDGSRSSPCIIPKSKQERIRDNQRRSRARRQEYLADLERRLKECHVACREAELQRTAFADLQSENKRLRDLLNYAGISSDVVTGFDRQRTPTHADHTAAALHRQIKPKYQPQAPIENANTMITKKPVSNPGSCCPMNSATSKLCAPPSGMSMTSPGIYGSQYSVPYTLTPPDTMSLSVKSEVSPTSSYEWMLRSHNRPSMDTPFCCDTLSVPALGPVWEDDGNTVQCSVAQMMINEYKPTPTEMEEITSRLATGFCLPRSTEPGCHVNTQLLFQILQEMNTRESYG